MHTSAWSRYLPNLPQKRTRSKRKPRGTKVMRRPEFQKLRERQVVFSVKEKLLKDGA